MAISTAAFATLVWGSVGLVVLVFLYELYAVLRDLGLLPAGAY